MNIHRKGTPGCEISFNHHKGVRKYVSFAIQIIEELPGNGYKNRSMVHKMIQYCLQREDYWMKTLGLFIYMG